MINREALAWAAGFFDGEGYTGLSKFSTTGRKGRKLSRWKRYPTISISQTGTGEELHRFNKAIGSIGKVNGPYGPYSMNSKPYYQFQLSGFEKVQAVVAMLWEFLCTPKREQATSVLERYLKQPNYKGELP